ncbi:Uncharacterised protein [Vibrio cholerae]|nr:Uncharacterised protein [Vibrio cholerae]
MKDPCKMSANRYTTNRFHAHEQPVSNLVVAHQTISLPIYRESHFPSIDQFWSQDQKSGFPSLNQLGCQDHWQPVHNVDIE